MEFVLNRRQAGAEVSVILIDWSVRESFHSLYYLNRQTVPRDAYELIWVEFYDRRPENLAKAVECFGRDHPALDKWIVLGYPPDYYFHKHRCYNAGIALAGGEICVICDSDAMFTPTFIENIIRGFEEHPGSFLHLDEIRNSSRRFYPFNFPAFDEVLEKDCINWTGTTTIGLDNSPDMLHEANYGACFAARREDLIRIGGADEHRDYLGYICGPYEMSFRLINAGLKEVWLRNEYLYHTWHPGESGINLEFHGPSDGRGMAQRALDSRHNGQVLPYHENLAIRRLRACGGEVDAALLVDAGTDAAWKEVAERLQADNRALLVAAGFCGFDVYAYRGMYYGVPACEGSFQPDRAHQGAYSRLFFADELDALKAEIRRASRGRRLRALVRTLIPRGGRIDRWLSRRSPLKRRISDFEDPRQATPQPSTPQLVRENFWGFNIIQYRNAWYAHRQNTGSFDVATAENGDCDDYLRGESEAQVVALVRSRTPRRLRLKHVAHRSLPRPAIRLLRNLVRRIDNVQR